MEVAQDINAQVNERVLNMAYDPFELARASSHAKLGDSDLLMMGKQASNMYLAGSCSLNDAVVKVAQECSGISSNQVQRVLEHANNSTFQSLFEKQAGDKNIEFDIADPQVVMRKMSAEVEAPVIRPVSQDYGKEPVKLGHENLEADLALCAAFGVDVTTPAMEKAAEGGFAGPMAAVGGIIGTAAGTAAAGRSWRSHRGCIGHRQLRHGQGPRKRKDRCGHAPLPRARSPREGEGDIQRAEA
jgi:hypothetical protein